MLHVQHDCRCAHLSSDCSIVSSLGLWEEGYRFCCRMAKLCTRHCARTGRERPLQGPGAHPAACLCHQWGSLFHIRASGSPIEGPVSCKIRPVVKGWDLPARQILVAAASSVHSQCARTDKTVLIWTRTPVTMIYDLVLVPSCYTGSEPTVDRHASTAQPLRHGGNQHSGYTRRHGVGFGRPS